MNCTYGLTSVPQPPTKPLSSLYFPSLFPYVTLRNRPTRLLCLLLMGFITYSANEKKTFVTMNVPQGDAVGFVSVALYSVAIVLTYPLQLFPAVNCIERRVMQCIRL